MNAQLQSETQAGAEITRLVEHARALGVADLYHGKRVSPRFNAALPLEAAKNPQDPSSCWIVSMHNVSMDGFAAWSKTELKRHDMLYVREFESEGERPWLKAVVRHCTRGIRGFLIGAEFLDCVVPLEHDDSPQEQHVGERALRTRKMTHTTAGIRRYREHGFR